MYFLHGLKYYLAYSEWFLHFEVKNKAFDMPLSSRAVLPEYIKHTRGF